MKLTHLGKEVQDLQFQLTNRGQVVQEGHTKDMLFSVDRLISEVSKFMTIKVGDLLFTGTPAGVAAVRPQDRLVGTLEGNDLLAVNIR